MEKLEYIRAFAEWNNKKLFSIGGMLKMLFVNLFFTAILYFIANLAKVNAELRTIMWVCVILFIFQFLQTIYMLFGFSRKKAGINFYYATSFINVSLFMSCSVLFIIFNLGHNSINDNVIVVYIISYAAMFLLCFVLNHILIMEGKFDPQKKSQPKSFFAFIAALGILISIIIVRIQNQDAIIMVIFSFIGSLLVVMPTATCFLRWYYILRYKI
jgi:hypothetical protein